MNGSGGLERRHRGGSEPLRGCTVARVWWEGAWEVRVREWPRLLGSVPLSFMPRAAQWSCGTRACLASAHANFLPEMPPGTVGALIPGCFVFCCVVIVWSFPVVPAEASPCFSRGMWLHSSAPIVSAAGGRCSAVNGAWVLSLDYMEWELLKMCHAFHCEPSGVLEYTYLIMNCSGVF